MPTVKLGSHILTEKSAPYVIAEIGVNHEGKMDLAKKLVDLAKEGGCNAAKFQTYKAGKIASKFSPSYWDLSQEPTTSQYKLFQKFDAFDEKEYEELAAHCKNVGIDFLSTPFDADAVDFLDPLMDYYKVASADLTNVPMLRQIAGKNKPVLLSTGAATLGEIDSAVQTLADAGCNDVVLLHCILNYPTPNKNAHLDMLEGLKRAYPTHVMGYSDHTLPDERMLILTAAWLKGAVVLEKHFTHDKTLQGNDHYHAMDVHDMKKFRENVALMTEVLGGSEHKLPLKSEAPAREHARRSIVPVHDIGKGEIITEEMITYKRPAHGISPLHWDEVIGMLAAENLEEDKPLQWKHLVVAGKG